MPFGRPWDYEVPPWEAYPAPEVAPPPPVAPWEVSLDNALAQDAAAEGTPVPAELLAEVAPTAPPPSMAPEQPVVPQAGFGALPGQPPAPAQAAPAQPAAAPAGVKGRAPMGRPSNEPLTADEYAAFIAPGVTQQQAGIAMEADALKLKSDMESEAAGEERDLISDRSDDRWLEERLKAKAVADAQKEADEEWSAIKEIDPAKFWSDRSTMDKAVGLMSAFIGGYLAPYNGGRNTALDTINAMIAQDIDAQKANQNRQATIAERADRRVGQVNAQWAEKLQDFDMRTVAMREGIKQGMLANASKYQSPFIHAQALKAAGELDKQNGEALAGIVQQRATFKEGTRRWEAENDRANAQFAFQRQQAAEAARERQLKAAPQPALFAYSSFNKAPLVIDPAIAAGMSDTEQREVRTQFQAQGEMISLLQQYEEEKAKLGRTNGVGANFRGLGSAERAKADARFKGIVGKLQKAITGAAAGKDEREAFMAQIGPLLDWTNVDSSGVTKQFIDEQQQARQRTVDTYNIRDARDPSKPFDVYAETFREPITDVTSSPQAFKAATDSVVRIYTGTPAQVEDNLGALADYVKNGGTSSAMVKNVIAGSIPTSGGVEVGFSADKTTNVAAISNVRAAAAKAAAEATAAGDKKRAKSILAEGERLVEALKPSGSSKRQAHPIYEVPTPRLGTR
jgi:hypothetical protein